MNAPSLPTDPRVRRHLWGAAGAGLLLRILLVVLCREDAPSGDAQLYATLAKNVAFHGVYAMNVEPPFEPTVVRAPLASLALSIPYRLFGDTAWPLHVLLVVTGLAGALTLALGVGRHVPRIAVPLLWALALSPFGALFAARLLSETFVSAAVSGAVGCLLLFSGSRAALASGALLGLAALAKDVYLPLIGLLPIATWWLERGRLGYGLRQVALSILMSALVIAPWTIRNASIGRPALVSKGLLGENLFIGTWERNPAWAIASHHDFPDEAFDSPEQKAQIRAMAAHPAESDAELRAIAIDRIRTRPVHTFGIWVRRAPYLWIGSRTELFAFRTPLLATGRPAWVALKGGAWLANLTILGLGVLSTLWVWRRRDLLRLVTIPVLFTGAVYFPLHSTENRYSEPVLALVLVLAVAGVASALDAWRARRGSAASTDR